MDARRQTANDLFRSGDYLKASRYYFSVYTDRNFRGDKGEMLGLITDSLIRAGYTQTAVYFYARTLKSGSRTGISRVLPHLPRMLDEAGGDVLKSYVLGFTDEDNYTAETRAHFFYFLGRDQLLKGDAAAALGSLGKITSGTSVWPQASQLRATAHAIQGQLDAAISAFKDCERSAGRLPRDQAADLELRCRAGVARVLYQKGDYAQADDLYDDIPKKSFVWTDILFEQAWNSYAKGDYNRALGKLVTYRSPHLNFVFNPEVDVLRAQSFLALCLYDDVNRSINEFNSRYQDVGRRLKESLQQQGRDYNGLYQMGLNARRSKLHSNDQLKNALNRSVRSPYFSALIQMEQQTQSESARLRGELGRGGYPDFLAKVSGWRLKTIRLLGGIFVKNTMVDLYNGLLADFDKMSFIKSEMLGRMKGRLLSRRGDQDSGSRGRGSSRIDRKDYQYYWSFNGEFWNDELGDYVFALDSECS
jgi:tetratricopeptide (TPR) repeat protein